MDIEMNSLWMDSNGKIDKKKTMENSSGEPLPGNPVENIYWPDGTYPLSGSNTVYVLFMDKRSNDKDSVYYRIRTKIGGKKIYYEGFVKQALNRSFGKSPTPYRDIFNKEDIITLIEQKKIVKAGQFIF